MAASRCRARRATPKVISQASKIPRFARDDKNQEEYRKTDAGWHIAFLRLTRLRLEPLFGKGVMYDLPPGRLWSEANDWLEKGR